MQIAAAPHPQAALLHSTRPGRRSCRLSIRASALPDQFVGRQFTVLSTSEDATAHLAAVLAAELRAGDAYCLKGDEGAGKSTFSQYFVRAALQDEGLQVVPPPQSLQPNEYAAKGWTAPDEFGDLPILHFDVGNLQRPSDDDCNMIAGVFPEVVSLIEWAEQLRVWGAAPEQRLALYFRRLPSQPEAAVRLVTVVPHTGAWECRVGLLQANLSISGPPSGLMMLSDDMAAQLTAGLPESLAAV